MAADVQGKVTLTIQRILTATCICAMAASGTRAVAQTTPCAARLESTAITQSAAQPAVAPSPTTELLSTEKPQPSATVVPCVHEPLFDLADSDTKFKLQSLMTTLRDPKHENWVLAAYPDPKTGRPLIGAGFSLDVQATDHPQLDPLNPHTFLEPSSAQLWEAAGLNPARLQTILDQYERELNAWKKKNFRRKIKTHQLSPQLTDADATRLLQVSVEQSVHNARAYCREFDQLTGSQQMALSELVYQMGVNLEEFVQFLGTLNDLSYRDLAAAGENSGAEADHWKAVQNTLIDSDWARRYSTRAVTVIAMFDPRYETDPAEAESVVRSEVHPLVMHHRKKAHASAVRAGNDGTHNHKTSSRAATDNSSGKS